MAQPADLQAVLARVAEKLHGWQKFYGGNLHGRWYDPNEVRNLSLDYLLTGNGTFETIERMRGQGWTFTLMWPTGQKASATFQRGSYDDDAYLGQGDTPHEAVARAADAALEGGK